MKAWTILRPLIGQVREEGSQQHVIFSLVLVMLTINPKKSSIR